MNAYKVKKVDNLFCVEYNFEHKGIKAYFVHHSSNIVTAYQLVRNELLHYLLGWNSLAIFYPQEKLVIDDYLDAPIEGNNNEIGAENFVLLIDFSIIQVNNILLAISDG